MRFGNESHHLIGGDSTSITAGAAFSITGGAVNNYLFRYTTEDWLRRLVGEAGESTTSHIFSRCPASAASDLLRSELADGIGNTIHDAGAGSSEAGSGTNGAISTVARHRIRQQCGQQLPPGQRTSCW